MENLRGPDERAAKRVKKEDDGESMVDGKTRVQFGDDLTYPHCTCSEWRHSRLPCKHFCLIFANIPEWGWEKLSSLYRESPLLNLDYDILAVNNNQAPTNDWVDTPDCSDTQETASKSSQDQLETIPLPARRQSKSKTLQVHCRKMLKEIVSSTYLITDENTLSKLAEEIDALYAKVKTMTPSDDGVPIGEVPSVGDSTKKHYTSTSTVPAPTISEVPTVSDSRKKQSPTTSTVPPSPQKHGAKKHPASGRYGVKAEWQRKFFPVKNCPSTSRKRKHSQANEPKKKLKKIKVKQKDLPSTDEEHYSFSQDATVTKPGSTHDDRQWELQKSHDVTAADQLPSNLGNHT